MFKDKHGRDPSDSDLTVFHDVSNSASQLAGYRNQATKLTLSFLETSVADQAKELEAQYSAKTANEILSFKPGFWRGVSQSVIGSGLFALLIGCLVFFVWSLKQGPRQVIEQVFDVMIVDAPPSDTAVALDEQC